MQRSAAVLSCKLCGRPYFPGERIEIVGPRDDSAVAHVECIEHAARQLIASLDNSVEHSIRGRQATETLVDSLDGR